MRKMWSAVAALGGSLALVAATQGTSHAAEATQSVPSCVKVTVEEFLQRTTIENTCSTTQSVRPVYENIPGPCFTLAPGEIGEYVTLLNGKFKHLEHC